MFAAKSKEGQAILDSIKETYCKKKELTASEFKLSDKAQTELIRYLDQESSEELRTFLQQKDPAETRKDFGSLVDARIITDDMIERAKTSALSYLAAALEPSADDRTILDFILNRLQHAQGNGVDLPWQNLRDIKREYAMISAIADTLLFQTQNLTVNNLEPNSAAALRKTLFQFHTTYSQKHGALTQCLTIARNDYFEADLSHGSENLNEVASYRQQAYMTAHRSRRECMLQYWLPAFTVKEPGSKKTVEFNSIKVKEDYLNQALAIDYDIERATLQLTTDRALIPLHRKISEKRIDDTIILRHHPDLELTDGDALDIYHFIFNCTSDAFPIKMDEGLYLAQPQNYRTANLTGILKKTENKKRTICIQIHTGGHWFFAEFNVDTNQAVTSVRYWDPLGWPQEATIREFLKNDFIKHKPNSNPDNVPCERLKNGVKQEWGMTCGYMSLKYFIDAHYDQIDAKIQGNKADKRRATINAIHQAKQGEDALVMQQVMLACLDQYNENDPTKHGHLKFLQQSSDKVVEWVKNEDEKMLKTTADVKGSASSLTGQKQTEAARIQAYGKFTRDSLYTALFQTWLSLSSISGNSEMQLTYRDAQSAEKAVTLNQTTNKDEVPNKLRKVLEGELGEVIIQSSNGIFVQIQMPGSHQGNCFDGQVGNNMASIFRYFAILQQAANLHLVRLDLSTEPHSACGGFSPQDIAIYMAKVLGITAEDKDGQEISNADELAKKTAKQKTLRAYVDRELQTLKKMYSELGTARQTPPVKATTNPPTPT